MQLGEHEKKSLAKKSNTIFVITIYTGQDQHAKKASKIVCATSKRSEKSHNLTNCSSLQHVTVYNFNNTSKNHIKEIFWALHKKLCWFDKIKWFFKIP